MTEFPSGIVSSSAGESSAHAEAWRQRVRDHLGGAQYEALFRAVRRRLEDAGDVPARSVTLNGLSEAQRAAVADLHGWSTLPGSRVRISLPVLDARLRESVVAAGLVDVVQALGGPLADRRAERVAAVRGEEQLWTAAAGHAAIASHSELAEWLEQVRSRGLLRRVARAAAVDDGRLLRQALEVVARLPAPGVPLSVLAAETTGDAHALDRGGPLATLVLRAAAMLAGWPKVPSSLLLRRRLWAEVGVLCDPLSSQVLVFGLIGDGTSRLGRQLLECAEAGEPRRITLREIALAPDLLVRGAHVLVCENPVVVAAAADRLGRHSAALVCTEGIPSTAALELLRRVRRSGASIGFHADFDWAGIRIGNLLATQAGAVPWRFAAGDYRRAIAAIPDAVQLRGTLARAAWDGDLDEVMRGTGRAVFEEQVLECLLDDLSSMHRKP